MSTSKDCSSTDGDKAYKNVLRVLSADGLDGAIMVVEKELEKDPSNWEALAAKADILYLRGLVSQACGYAKKAVAANPNNALAWNTLGNILYKMKKYDDAIECYNHAIELDPMIAKAWYNKKLALDFQMKTFRPRITSRRCCNGNRSDSKLSSKRCNKDEGDGSLSIVVGGLR
jgi:tetratricopeptide (TPR) repeat protein